MKKLLLIILFLGVNSICFSQDSKLTNDEKKQILAESPFNNVYPESILKSSATYFKAQMGLYKEGAIAEKEAHLVALGTSVRTVSDLLAFAVNARDKNLGTQLLGAGGLNRIEHDVAHRLRPDRLW